MRAFAVEPRDLASRGGAQFGSIRQPERLDREVDAPARDEVELRRKRPPALDPAGGEVVRHPHLREIERKQILAAVERDNPSLEAESAPRSFDLGPRAGEALHFALRSRNRSLRDGRQVLEIRRLENEHPVPEVRADADQLAGLQRSDVRALQWLSAVDEPGGPRVRPEKHRSVGAGSEKGLEGRLVTAGEKPDLHGHAPPRRAHLFASRTFAAILFDTIPGMKGTTRAALVTGGTRGIGFAVARALAEEGLAVAVSGRSEESVRAAVERLGRLLPSARFAGRAADARSEAAQRALVQFVAETFGRLDVLVNNAGIGEFDSIENLDPERFRAVVETNLFGPYYATHFAIPLMKRRGGGFIVNIASLAGINAFAGGSAYNASKFGLLGFSDATMLDLRHQGIRVAAILPGSVATEFGHSHGDRDHTWMLSSDDVARAVVDVIRFPDRAIASRIDLRPSRPPKR